MFDFPKAERIQYNRNFLKTVIFQVMYTPRKIIEFDEKIKDIVLSDFPKKNSIIREQVVVKFEKSRTPLILSENPTAEGYEYRSVDGKKIFAITSDTISLTILGDNYTIFDDEVKPFQNYVDKITSFLEIDKFVRVAIRKVNILEFLPQLQIHDIEFLSVLFKNLRSADAIMLPYTKILSGMTQYTFIDGNYQMNLSCGLTPPMNNTKDGKRVATLDIDIYNNKQETLLGNLPNEMKKINESIFDIFDFMISNELKSFMMEGKNK